MTITLISLTDTCSRITFTWSDDMEDCSFEAIGDHDVEAMVAANAHEGADFPGYRTGCAWT